jgi:hypothetical protein
MEGTDVHQIAKSCRTSVEMIDKYLASHIKTTLDAAAINLSGRRKPTEADDTPEPNDEGLLALMIQLGLTHVTWYRSVR